FIAFSTWKWADLAGKTGGKPVFRYFYTRPRPAMKQQEGPVATGAVHSAEIEYAMGNLASNKVYAWTPEDYEVSRVMQGYFANFVKKGDPNGEGLPQWPAANAPGGGQVMRIDVKSSAAP